MLATDKKALASHREDARLRALEEYGVLDTPPDVDLDRLVELAARICEAPIAALSLVGDDRLFSKARFGTQVTGIAREGSFCTYAIEGDSTFVVKDATKDLRFASHPAVTNGPKLRFYAGVPLVGADGEKIGALCILDCKQRSQFTEKDRKNLEDVAALVRNRLELRRLHRARAAGNQRFEQIVAGSPDVIVSGDASGPITSWNAAAQALFGYPAEDVIGQSIGFLFADRVRKLQTAEILSLVRDGTLCATSQQLQVTALHRDSFEFPAEMSLTSWREDGDAGFCAIIRNLSDKAFGEQKLFQVAQLDPLTRLPGRTTLLQRLEQAVKEGAGTLLLLDLDGFKDLNDTLGHAAGDTILNETGERLRARAHSDATVSRLGSDEFAVLVRGSADKAQASELADGLLRSLRMPFSIDGETVHLSASIGIATFPNHGDDAE